MKHYLNVLFLALGLGIVFLLFKDSHYKSLILIGIFGLYFVILSIGVLWLRANYFLNSIHKVKPPYVLLTFDDGPDEFTTPEILKTLNKHNVKALFFVVGEKAEKNSNLVKQINDEGHLVCNHTFSHPYLFALCSGKKVTEEIAKGNEAIKNILGFNVNYFRPPIGYTNPIIARAVKKLGIKVIGWNKRSFDSVVKNPQRLKKRMLGLTKAGRIILLHDNLLQTQLMLSDYIEEAKKNGIIFANSECINSLLK